MNDLQIAVAKGTVACPHLPPVPVMDPLSGRVKTLVLTSCVKDLCAVYASCQGADSPAKVRRSNLEMLVEVLDGLKSLPAVGLVLGTVGERIKARLQADKEPVGSA